jgi:penicillin-binding protein 1C
LGLVAAGLLAAVSFTLDAAFPLPVAKSRNLSRVLLAQDGTVLRVTATNDDKFRLPLRLSDVDPRFIRLLIAYEDRRFTDHAGVDPLARALTQWAVSGTVVSGASTLTMQVARLLEPRPLTLWSKGLEMLRALQLEAHLSKKEILGIYLTLAPYGGNLEGIRAASLAWLGKEPAHLTDAEAALLVVLPQAPSRLRPDRHPERARTARDKVLQRSVKYGALTERDALLAMRDGVPAIRRAFPFHAVHLADALFAAGSEPSVRTTLDASLQTRTEALVAAHALKAGPRVGAAVLVADHRDAMAVRVWVGSADYLSVPRLGAVDMVRAIRSPGSTLKPFIYGLAFDRVLAHPNTWMADAPRRFGRYAPGNFDDRYRGNVTAAEALRLSLNIPAVAMMERLGPNRFTHALEAVGAPISLPPGERPGLAVALGGCGLTLERLVTLYGALGSGGHVQPLKLAPDAAPGGPRPLLDPDTARTIAAILEDAAPARGMAPAHLLAGMPRVAVKTGTSFGFRDAWAVGVDGRYAVGVWVGRVDGTPRPGRIGRDDALSLLHAIFGLLPPDPRRELSKPVRPLSEPAPLALRKFENPFASADPAVSDLALDFPPDGVTLALSHRGRFRPMPLRAKGGVGEVRWLVNGRPLDHPVWRPDGPGAATITVLDTLGRFASSTIWVE